MRIVVKDKNKLYQSTPALEKFLSILPNAPDGLDLAREQIRLRNYPRKEMSDILFLYNKEMGNDVSALKNCEKLREAGSMCIFTGQQLGLMGGPFYTILKAITAILMAREVHAIPIFWLATEDHDVNEIDHTYNLDSLGNLDCFHLSFSKGQPVEDLRLSVGNVEEINRFIKQIGFKKPLWDIPPSPGDSYSEVMIRILVKLFAGTGLVFVEPKLLRPFAVDFLQKEIVEADKIVKIIRKTTEQLVHAGGESRIATDEGTNLFIKTEEGFRHKVVKIDGDFLVVNERLTTSQLLSLAKREPELFSYNVAARPVLQNLLFPTLAYVAGPNELAYHHQLLDYFNFHHVPMPWIVPRLSATILTPDIVSLLEKCDLKAWETIPENWSELMPEIEEEMLLLTEKWHESALELFSEDISSDSLTTLVRHSVKGIQNRILKNRLHKRGIPTNALHFLRNVIHPHNKPQERVLNWFGLQAKTQDNLLEEFLAKADWKSQSHLYCYLSA